MTDHRSAPRRRGDALVAAIHGAVLAELDANGYSALSMEAVAERARVSKASLYRRWARKMDLVIDAVSATFPEPADLEDTGSLRGDLLAHLRGVARLLSGPTGAALRGLFSDAIGEPNGPADARSRVQGRSARSVRVLVARAVARGEVPDVELTPRQAVAGHALLRHHFLWHDEVPDELIVQIVDEVVVPLVLSASARPAPSAAAPS
jgi:AcrR family transcriptional regulator